jgi:hydroxymethylbilane synthase
MSAATSVGRIRIGTRGSALALRQTQLVADALRARCPGVEVEVVRIETEADRARDRPLAQLGDKGVFVRALERALLGNAIDCAVHSLKDVPGEVDVPGLELAAYSSRADPRDCLISRDGLNLARLPPGARIGTSSLRREVQLRALRPDLDVVPMRGNVDTRLRKLREGGYEGIILAAAGLERLGLEEVVSEYLPVEAFVPDAGQGILAVQVREGDPVATVVSQIDDPASRCEAAAERSLVRALGADCRSPVGAYAVVEGDELELLGMAASADGRQLQRARRRGRVEDAEHLGERVGHRLLTLLRG